MRAITSRRQHRRLAVLAALFAFILLITGSTILAYVQQRREITALSDQVARQEAEVKELTEVRERWNDPAYVEQQARARLKFVYPGESPYVVLDPAEVSEGPGRIASSIGSGQDQPWFEAMWRSARTADAPGATR